MEVHAGEHHSEILQCGLYDYKTKDLANLETHLSTFTNVIGATSGYVTQIGDIKTHMVEKHESENIKILHGKLDRHNEEEIDVAEHFRFDLFPKIVE